jgi:hypothetical protein
MLVKSNPDEARRLIQLAQEDVLRRWQTYQAMAQAGSEAPADVGQPAKS